MMGRLVLVLLVVWLGTGAAGAVDDPREMLANPALEQGAEQIGRQLRCLVCQNEDIEDSGADLARDLRRIVRVQVSEGRSAPQIMAWMTARYGNFVRLRPPFNMDTVLLWGSPVLALACAGGIVLLGRQRRATPPAAPLDPNEQARLKALLEQ